MPKRYPASTNRKPTGRPKDPANRRRRLVDAAAAVAPAPAPSSAAVANAPARPVVASRVAVRPSPPSLRVNYDYVLRDLRRIALTAGALVVGLVGLSFVIR